MPLNEMADMILSRAPGLRGRERVFDNEWFRCHWERARAKVGMREFRLHDFRHAFAT
jgi:integrase